MVFGQEIWAGWPMIVVVSVFSVPPAVLARYKLRYAKILHNKALYADADMSKTDWMTSVATAVGVLGVGVGLWWADPAAATLVALSRRLRRGGQPALDDQRGGRHPDPHLRRQTAAPAQRADHPPRPRMFVVPAAGDDPAAEHLGALNTAINELDWKAYDVVVALVPETPTRQVPVEVGARGA